MRREGEVIRSITELDACCWGQPMHYRNSARLRVIKHQLKGKCEGRGQHIRRRILLEGAEVEDQAQVLIIRPAGYYRRH